MGDRKLNEKIEEMFARYGVNNPALISELHERILRTERDSRTFECPECRTSLTFKLRVDILRVRKLSESEGEEEPASIKTVIEKFTEEEKVFLSSVRENGIYSAFIETLDKALAIKPKDTEKYFLTWIRLAGKVKIPNESLWRLLETFDGKIDVFASQNIAAVVVDGALKQFYPYCILKGESFSRLTPNGAQITRTNENMTTEIWRPSKFGYVVGKGAFFTEIQAKSKGAFDNTGK